ncbi:DUF6640 family protein [Renibacterium salmoninarum]|uniref:DUF6640 family protein n=1 Tax=Renibacterium salmoninarum TaxID=1646 RepID=UPI000314AE38|nr:DUF6640 family protein [Renibacterium salmoninarum]
MNNSARTVIGTKTHLGGGKLSFGKAILTLTSVVTMVSPYLADFNRTHVFNPEWTPHAKFHNGQTMGTGAALGAAALLALWKRGDFSRGRLEVAAASASLYWLTQASALLYPGAKMLDADGDRPANNKGPQWAIFSGILAMNAWAYRSEIRKILRGVDVKV